MKHQESKAITKDPSVEKTRTTANSGNPAISEVKEPNTENIDPEPDSTILLKDIKLYKLDPSGCKITDIYWKNEDYVIVKAGGRVNPIFSNDPVTSKEQRKRYMKLGQSLARINSLEPGRVIQRRNPVFGELIKLFRKDSAKPESIGTGSGNGNLPEINANSRDYFSREVARAIALCLEDMEDKSKEILDALEHKVVNLKQNEYRMLYLLACFVLMVIYVGLVLFLTYDVAMAPTKSSMDFFVANNTVPLRATLMGALAGFFSVSLGIQKLNFDLDARYYLIISYGFMRLFVAIIASLFIYYAIQSGMVFANLVSSTPKGNATLYVLAFLSGFSEHYVPNVLNKIESTHSEPTATNKQKQTKKPDKGSLTENPAGDKKENSEKNA